MATPEEKEQLALIAKRLRERNRADDERRRRRVLEARAEADRLVRCFRQIDPHLERVVLFGSLAENRVRTLDSDIDLAVRSDEFLRLVACALNSDFHVDVVDLDRLPDHLRRSVEQRGVTLYAREA